jgi:acetyltransferase-like isoleucine patch superfamily enzyme
MVAHASRLQRVWWKIAEARPWVTSRVMAFVWLRACDSVGAKTRTFFRPHIENRGRIVIGKGVRLNSNWAPLELVTGPHGIIEIDDGVYINYGTLVSAHRRVHIGAQVMIGSYAIIGDTDIPGIGMPKGAPPMEAREIEIGQGAWIASRVTILPGARVGAGAVIAAGSVIAGEIPPGAVAGGIPARVLRSSASAPAASAGAVGGEPGGHR